MRCGLSVASPVWAGLRVAIPVWAGVVGIALCAALTGFAVATQLVTSGLCWHWPRPHLHGRHTDTLESVPG